MSAHAHYKVSCNNVAREEQAAESTVNEELGESVQSYSSGGTSGAAFASGIAKAKEEVKEVTTAATPKKNTRGDALNKAMEPILSKCRDDDAAAQAKCDKAMAGARAKFKAHDDKVKAARKRKAEQDKASEKETKAKSYSSGEAAAVEGGKKYASAAGAGLELMDEF